MFPARGKQGVERCKDSGLAMVLICLVCYQIWKLPVLVPVAMIFLLLTMTCARILAPFSMFWFGLSALLGTVVSRVILTGLFFGLVLPVGLLRRALGKDSMQVKRWKRGKGSVFRTRDHRFVAEDLGHPY